MGKIIDCHGHYWPPGLMEPFKATPFARSVSFLWDNPACCDLDQHIRVMDSLGIDTEVLVPSPILLETFRAAGVTSEEGMRMVNDAQAEAARAYPGRFIGTVAVDPFAGKAAVNEIERGVIKLGLKAVSIKTSYDGLYIDDEQFWPIHQLAQELGVPVMAHPGVMTRYWKETQRAKTTVLRAEISMLLDTTICIGRFVRFGIFDRFPEARFLFCQLGGTIPFLFGRFDLLDNMYLNSPKEAVEGEAMFPVRSLRDYKGRILADCHSMDRVAIECAAENLGVDSLVVGGDYPLSPWQFGLAANPAEIRQTRLSAADKDKILGGNAARILNLR